MSKKCFLTKNSAPLWADCIEKDCQLWTSSPEMYSDTCAITAIAEALGQIMVALQSE